MKTRYFGNVRADIFKEDKRIELSFMKRGKQPLGANYPQVCLSWAITALKPYTDKGFILSCPEPSSG